MTAATPSPAVELIVNMGEKDDSANALVPVLERDPLLIGLAQLAQQLRIAQTKAVTSPQLQMRR